MIGLRFDMMMLILWSILFTTYAIDGDIIWSLVSILFLVYHIIQIKDIKE